jgi:hypothetical protein
MEHHFFTEEGGFSVYCNGLRLETGKWGAFAFIVRKRDQHLNKVPGVRHVIRDVEFDSEQEAVLAAYDLASRLIQDQQTGL